MHQPHSVDDDTSEHRKLYHQLPSSYLSPAVKATVGSSHQQPSDGGTLSTRLDPDTDRPRPSHGAVHSRKPSSSSSPARLPRTSSLLPPHRTAAAAATTPDALTPAYSPSEHRPILEYSLQPDPRPETPPDDFDNEDDIEPEQFSSKIELPVLTLPPILPLLPLTESLSGQRSSLEVLPGDDTYDTEIPGIAAAQAESTASSDIPLIMSFEPVREPYPANRGHSRSRNGQSSNEKSSVDLAKPRSAKPPSQKAMLSRALQKANTAVQLDNAQNFEGARESYAEACELLHHVLLKTTTDEDKKKLEAIRRTYSGRIDELDQMTPWRAANNKELPARPGSEDPEESAEDDDNILEGSDAANYDTEDSYGVSRGQRQLDTRYLSDSSQEMSRPSRPADHVPLQSAFSRSPRRLRSLAEQTEEEMRTPQASHGFVHHRPSSPPKTETERRGDRDRDLPHQLPPVTLTDRKDREPAGHLRDGSQNSWLDPIDESGGSSNSSAHSRTSSSGYQRKHIRDRSGNTETEFDTALDAAIEAAYDDGFEPMSPHDYSKVDRTDEIVTKALRKVEQARERVRQTEREAFGNEQSKIAGCEQDGQTLPLDQSTGFYDDISSDEEERILEEMTRDYDIEDFMMSGPQIPIITEPLRPGSRGVNEEPEKKSTKEPMKHLATAIERPAPQHPVPKSLQPTAPPPTTSLPELPLPRATSPSQSVRNRRLSGQNPKQLKIQTTKLKPSAETASYEDLQQTRSAVEPRSELGIPPGQVNRIVRKPTPTYDAPVSEPLPLGSPPNNRSQVDITEDSAARSGSPSISKLRKNFSSSSLRSMKSRNLSISNLDEGSDMSPGTPSSNLFGGARTPAIPALPTPLVSSLRDQMETGQAAGLYLLEDNIHLPETPGSPNPMVLDPPAALEPCPNDVMLRPFWLMRCLYQTLVHPRGGYLSTKLFVPRDVWKVKGVKLKNIEDKIANCDLLTAALLKLAKVDTCDADAMLDEMQALEGVLEQVQAGLTRKLGNEVGVQGSGVLFKEASNAVEGDATAGVPRTSSVSAKSSSFSWRRLRSKNSSLGLGGAYNSRLGGAEGSKEPLTMPTLPMVPQPTSRPPKRDVFQAQFIGPNANYMGSLARLFDAAQAIDQIARQVDDPGLRHADKTQVGLELCTRHAAEFFGFYICRFVLADLGMLLDKFIKRGSEWVLA